MRTGHITTCGGAMAMGLKRNSMPILRKFGLSAAPKVSFPHVCRGTCFTELPYNYDSLSCCIFYARRGRRGRCQSGKETVLDCPIRIRYRRRISYLTNARELARCRQLYQSKRKIRTRLVLMKRLNSDQPFRFSLPTG